MRVDFQGLSDDRISASRQLEMLWGAVVEFLELHCDVDRTGLRRCVVFRWHSRPLLRAAVLYKTKAGALVVRVTEGPEKAEVR